jgi:hypothetical protein
LLNWANAFSPQITATPTAFGLVAGQATSYASTLSAYADALLAATAENTRTKGTVAAKNTAKLDLIAASRQLAGVVAKHPGITDEQLSDLGLIVPDRNHGTVFPPAVAPIVASTSVASRIVRGTLRDATFPSVRRRPANAKGATILIAWGTTPPPSGDPGWLVAGQTGRTTFTVQFPNSVPGGMPCYISALWYNERGEYSPASDPITVYLSAPAAGEEAA